jgi:hypothetical protein
MEDTGILAIAAHMRKPNRGVRLPPRVPGCSGSKAMNPDCISGSVRGCPTVLPGEFIGAGPRGGPSCLPDGVRSVDSGETGPVVGVRNRTEDLANQGEARLAVGGYDSSEAEVRVNHKFGDKARVDSFVDETGSAFLPPHLETQTESTPWASR